VMTVPEIYPMHMRGPRSAIRVCVRGGSTHHAHARSGCAKLRSCSAKQRLG